MIYFFNRGPLQSLALGILMLPSVLAGALTSCAPQLLSTSGSTSSTGASMYGLLYTSDQVATATGTALPTLTPSFASGSAVSWSISPSLPAGLSINPTTGVISGTPTAATPSASSATFTTYTVTATSASGQTATFPIKLLVADVSGGAGSVVTSTATTGDASPNNGVCEAPCTLRAAINTLNGTGSAANDTIILGAGTYTIASDGDLDISKSTLSSVVICGQDKNTTIIDGQGIRRILRVSTGGAPLKLTFCNLTLTNGYLSAGRNGAAVDFEQVIDNNELVLSNVIVSNSTTASSAGTGCAVYNGNGGTPTNNTTTISNTTFINNQGYDTGAALCVYAASGKTATLNMTNSYFKSNFCKTSGGAGLLASNSNTTISNTTFESNTASSVSGSGVGGAISFVVANTVNIKNSTFLGNSSKGFGGAIDFESNTITGTLAFNTFVNNTTTTASGGGAISTTVGAIAVNVIGNVFSGNTAAGSPYHCLNDTGSLINLGYNAYTTSGGSCGSASGTDSASSNVMVDTATALNGGEIVNLALQSGSPAINLVPNSTCSTYVTTDTRGFSRPNGSACDAGAFEY